MVFVGVDLRRGSTDLERESGLVNLVNMDLANVDMAVMSLRL